MIEDVGIDERARVVTNLDFDLVRARAGGDHHDLVQALLQIERARAHRHRIGVQPREVEQLLDERGHAEGLLLERRSELLLLRFGEAVAEMVERLHEAVDRRHRCAQLVRRERDEVCHQLVRSFEHEARLVLLLEQTDAVERGGGESTDRLEETQLVVAEERRVRRRPRRHAQAGQFDATLAVAIRRAVHREQTPGLVSHRKSACADEGGCRLCDAGRDLAPRRRERGEIAHRALQPSLLGGAPVGAHDLRRVDPEQEGDDRDERDHLDDQRSGRALVGRERDADDRDGQRRGCEAEHAHAVCRDRRLVGPCAPEPGRDDDREQGPVDEKGDDVRVEPRGPRVAGCGETGQHERPDRQADGERGDRRLEAPARRRERRRELVEQEREDDEQLDVEPLTEPCADAVRVGGHEPADRDEQGDRDECEREPPGREVAMPEPAAPGDDREQHKEYRVRDADRDDGRVQTVPPGLSTPRGILRLSQFLGGRATIRQ